MSMIQKIIAVSIALFIMLAFYNQQYALNFALLVMAAFLSAIMAIAYYGGLTYGLVKAWQLFCRILKKLYYWHKGAEQRFNKKLLISATRAYRKEREVRWMDWTRIPRHFPKPSTARLSKIR